MEDLRLKLDTAVPLGLIINELLINSFRHAFPEGKDGIIEVSCGTRGEELVIRISDNSKGTSAGAGETDGAHSLGLMIVEALVDQLGARAHFDDDADGVSTEIHIPL